MIVTVDDLINELSKYPRDMEVYYATKYALVPCSVNELEDGRCISIDIDDNEKSKYKDWRDTVWVLLNLN